MSIGFILIPGYALMSLASAVEPLRAANHLAGRTLYRSAFYSIEGGFLPSTCGGGFETEPLASVLAKGEKPDIALVVAGGNPMFHEDAALERCLRALQIRGISLGGISGGAAILAKAGLMTGRRFTVHWAHIDPLTQFMPDLLIERAVYVIDRDRYTCAGGVAALDMMCALLARENGIDLARQVSDWFIHPRLRAAEEPQQSPVAHRFNLHHPVLEAAVELMTSHIADPLSPVQLATLCGCSVRQLQRLFVAHLGSPLMGFYRNLRLDKADELLQQSTLSVLDVALLTGFANAAHFTRSFSTKYQMSPARRRHQSV
ncbi:MAG: GlxA family transcriptional regulator [Mesorhizobium sp.]|nr:MAG: GlxA family transcriptional regulator [Mesorhizobium sp.]